VIRARNWCRVVGRGNGDSVFNVSPQAEVQRREVRRPWWPRYWSASSNPNRYRVKLGWDWNVICTAWMKSWWYCGSFEMCLKSFWLWFQKYLIFWITNLYEPCIMSEICLLLSRSRLCRYSVGGAWWHLCFYESFQYPVRVISPAKGVESEGVNMTKWATEIG
jgi:hypothetical protein